MKSIFFPGPWDYDLRPHIIFFSIMFYFLYKYYKKNKHLFKDKDWE